MKRQHRLLASSLLPLALLFAPSASAQMLVHDPAVHAQTVLQAARALQQVEQQIEQLAHEIDMLENMARDLEAMPDSIAEDIRTRLVRLDTLMQRAEGIGYRVGDIERAYDDAFPETYADTTSSAALVADARARWRQSRAAYRDSLLTTAEVISGAAEDAGTLDGLIASSQSAIGNLQAAQAANQIGALQAEQLMQIEAMLAAQIRAESLERARALAEAERGRARTRAFLGN